MSNLTRSEINRRYYLKNKEKIDARTKENRAKNLDTYNARSRKWYQENKGEELRASRREYDRKRYQDPVARLAQNMRVRLKAALKSKKSKVTEKLVGCSFEELKKHLELQFQPGMSWENYGQWHVDHIVPLASASDIDQLEQLCHFSNLQPLWADQNRKKSKKVS